jgi:hypothetical protein
MDRAAGPKLTTAHRRTFVAALSRDGVSEGLAVQAYGRLTLAKRLPPARRERAVRAVAALVARGRAS